MNSLKRLLVVVIVLASMSDAQAGLIALYDDVNRENYVSFGGLGAHDYVTGFEFTVMWEPENYVHDFATGSLAALVGEWEVFQELIERRDCDVPLPPLLQCANRVRVIGRQTSYVTDTQRQRQRALIAGGFSNPFPGTLPLYSGIVVGRYNDDGSYDVAVQIRNVSFADVVVYGENNQVLFAVPEPGTFALFGVGLVGIAFLRRRQAMKPQR